MNTKLATAMLLLCSCSDVAGVGLTGGPLQEDFDADGRIEMCSRSKPGGKHSFGDLIENTTDASMTVTDASFESAKGVKVLGFMRIDFAEGPGVGSIRDYPPRNYTKPEWSKAEPLEGSVIRPGEQWGVVVGLQLEAKRGTAKHLSITYEMDGEEYVAQDYDSYEMRGRCK